MGSSCTWVLYQVSAPEIKLDGTGYVAWGVKTDQGAASKSGLQLELPRSQRHARERLPAAQYAVTDGG